MRVLATFLLGSLAACGRAGGPESGFSGGTQSTPTSGQGESSSTGTSTGAPGGSTGSSSTPTSGGATGSSTGGSTDDGGTTGADIPDFGPTAPAGCEGRVDFLFVISAQGTMKPVQERMIAAFPGFIGAIQEQLPDFDVHILVADGDDGWKIGDCSVCTTDCDPQGTPPYCGAMIVPCDKGEWGGSVTFPAGTAASNRRCELDGDRRYIMTGQQDMADTFACMAQVGTGGGGAVAQAMVAALQPAINDPDDDDACNRGFLRDDALLVVTIMLDGYENESLGTVEEWIEGLRAAKKYDDDAFMVLVLTTDVDVGFDQLCLPDEWNQTKNPLRLLAEGVKHGFVDSICLDDYVPFFTEHVTHLVDLCDDFVPPG